MGHLGVNLSDTVRFYSANPPFNVNILQLSWTGANLYHFKVSIGHNANFQNFGENAVHLNFFFRKLMFPLVFLFPIQCTSQHCIGLQNSTKFL